MSQPAPASRQEQFSGTKDVMPQHLLDVPKLEKYLSEHVEGFEGPLTLRQFKGGQSNPTYQLVTPKRKYVLRRKPPGKLLPSAHAVDREYRIISALYPTGFPVPKLVTEGKLPPFRSNVKVELDGDVAVVRVFRPEVKNALSKRTLHEIDSAITELGANAAVKGIVLTGEGGALAGADIGELSVLPDAEACRTTCLASHPIFARISASCTSPEAFSSSRSYTVLRSCQAPCAE